MTPSISGEAPIARRRTPSVLAVGVLFLVLGAMDVYRGIGPLIATTSPLAAENMQLLAIGIAALVGGAFVLRGQNWARWLLAVWMLLHVAISVGQPRQFIGHLMIFGFVAFLLFRPGARSHFGPKAATQR
jgi:hypothetical protein